MYVCVYIHIKDDESCINPWIELLNLYLTHLFDGSARESVTEPWVQKSQPVSVLCIGHPWVVTYIDKSNITITTTDIKRQVTNIAGCSNPFPKKNKLVLYAKHMQLFHTSRENNIKRDGKNMRILDFPQHEEYVYILITSTNILIALNLHMNISKQFCLAVSK